MSGSKTLNIEVPGHFVMSEKVTTFAAVGHIGAESVDVILDKGLLYLDVVQ